MLLLRSKQLLSGAVCCGWCCARLVWAGRTMQHVGMWSFCVHQAASAPVHKLHAKCCSQKRMLGGQLGRQQEECVHGKCSKRPVCTHGALALTP